MHYSHMIRFDNVEEAKRLQVEIDRLKQLNHREFEEQNVAEDCCSETETEGDDQLSNSISSEGCSQKISNSKNSNRSTRCTKIEEVKDDDVPLISLLPTSKKNSHRKISEIKSLSKSSTEVPGKSLWKSTVNQQKVVGRKRVRVIVSDDEGETNDEDVATSDECKSRNDYAGAAGELQDVSLVNSKCALGSCNPVNLEESTCSYKCLSPKVASQNNKDMRPSFSSEQYLAFRIENDLIHAEVGSSMVGNNLSIESMKIEVACLYYLQLPSEKRLRGLLPIIQNMTYGGRDLESFEAIENLKDQTGKGWVEVSIGGWVQKRLMKLYIDSCKESSEAPNLKLLKKLYNLEVSEDEVIASECELQDISVTPLLNALHAHKTVATIDLSHNMLGNGTMEKLQQVFTSSLQKYGGLVLDLHCNRFGPTALFQICECPVLFTRLEVLNISGNRLTDSCGSYLATILENCKALYSLNIERCSITSRTIQKVVDALDTASVLAQLSLGYNNTISGNVMLNLLAKLGTLRRFSELSLNGLKLSKPVVDSLCQLSKSSSLSGLMLGGTNIGTDGALQLTKSLFDGNQELLKLDLSYCGLTSEYITRQNTDATLISGILELNLGGNPIMQEGGNILASLLANSQCCLKVLILSKCQLGYPGILQIIQALAENNCLEELNLAENAHENKHSKLHQDSKAKGSLESLLPNINISESSHKVSTPVEVDATHNKHCALNPELEVADSEDDPMRVESAVSGFDYSCTSSCQRNHPFPDCQLIQELSTAINNAKELQLLDLSNNGLPIEVAETLYVAWSSSSRSSLAERHIQKDIVHFSMRGNTCCGVKTCCKRDWFHS